MRFRHAPALLLLCASVAAGDVDALRAKAKAGDVHAQYQLGLALAGRPDTAARGEAGNWLDRAGRQGEPRAFDALVTEAAAGHVVFTFAGRKCTPDEAAFYCAAMAVAGGSGVNATRVAPGEFDRLRVAKDFDAVVLKQLAADLLGVSDKLARKAPAASIGYLRAAVDWGSASAEDRLGGAVLQRRRRAGEPMAVAELPPPRNQPHGARRVQ